MTTAPKLSALHDILLSFPKRLPSYSQATTNQPTIPGTGLTNTGLLGHGLCPGSPKYPGWDFLLDVLESVLSDLPPLLFFRPTVKICTASFSPVSHRWPCASHPALVSVSQRSQAGWRTWANIFHGRATGDRVPGYSICLTREILVQAPILGKSSAGRGSRVNPNPSWVLGKCSILSLMSQVLSLKCCIIFLFTYPCVGGWYIYAITHE